MIIVSRAALAAAIDRSRSTGRFAREAATRVIQPSYGADDVVAVYADRPGTIYGMMVAYQAEHGYEAAMDLVERTTIEDFGTGVIAIIADSIPAEPIEGPGSVRQGNEGFLATSRVGCEMTFEDEVTAWEFAESQTY